ncbi:hypothetical protein EZV62_008888 [Acer yangbiense]|uniref:Uncharacterized protein n=1 Tax=Acer yangbiense TaxID=1000413 RepID=A0A5C7IEC1_9ROSI|nr:hypothetical protein EZV62_008888 [Acer yangbiense]
MTSKPVVGSIVHAVPDGLTKSGSHCWPSLADSDNSILTLDSFTEMAATCDIFSISPLRSCAYEENAVFRILNFKSRVRYINVLDPTNMCYYVSEILDARRDGPLFMVSLENCSSEVFVHVSAARCWELVRDRVNQEVTKQHKLGRMNLPPLRPPRSLDGLFYSWESGNLDDKHLYKNLVRPTNEARTLGGVVGSTIPWPKSCIRLL